MACAHEDFMATVDVARVAANEITGPIEGFYAEIHLHCAHCAEPFVFRGVPVGLSQARPMMSADATELRVPCLPQSADPHFGMGIPGFVARVRDGETSTSN